MYTYGPTWRCERRSLRRCSEYGAERSYTSGGHHSLCLFEQERYRRFCGQRRKPRAEHVRRHSEGYDTSKGCYLRHSACFPCLSQVSTLQKGLYVWWIRSIDDPCYVAYPQNLLNALLCIQLCLILRSISCMSSASFMSSIGGLCEKATLRSKLVPVLSFQGRNVLQFACVRTRALGRILSHLHPRPYSPRCSPAREYLKSTSQYQRNSCGSVARFVEMTARESMG